MRSVIVDLHDITLHTILDRRRMLPLPAHVYLQNRGYESPAVILWYQYFNGSPSTVTGGPVMESAGKTALKHPVK